MNRTHLRHLQKKLPEVNPQRLQVWKSSPGKDLLFSVVLFPDRGIVPSLITVTASLAVAVCLREKVRVKTRIKFPNDVVIGSKKVAGVLVEKSTSGSYILGIGLNVNETKGPLKDATSLRIAKKKIFDRNLLAREILMSLDTWYAQALAGEISEIDLQLARYSTLLGKEATVIQNRKKFTGTVAGLSAVKGLTLKIAGGEKRTFKAEHITIGN